MDDEPLSGDLLSPNAPLAVPSAASVALARRISRGVPSADLQALLHGPIGEAVADAAGYADNAIAETTRAAYAQGWDHFADWCRSKNVDPDALPLNPVLVAAYLSALAKTHGASALRSRVAAIAYHHRRRGFVFLPTHPVLRETLSGIRRRHPRKVRSAAALCAPEIKQLLAVCPADLAGLRDRALFLVGFAGSVLQGSAGSALRGRVKRPMSRYCLRNLPCRSGPMPTVATISRSSGTGPRTQLPTTPPCASAAA